MQWTNLLAVFKRPLTRRPVRQPPLTLSTPSTGSPPAGRISADVQPILLRMADLDGLEEISVTLFHDMRQLIVNQDGPRQRIGMASRLQQLLRTRFKASHLEVEGWKTQASDQWSSERDRQFRGFSNAGLAAAFRPLTRSAIRARPQLGPELKLHNQSTSLHDQRFHANDTTGKLRLELLVKPTGRGWLRSFDLRTGSWLKRTFSCTENGRPNPQAIQVALQRAAQRCGWQLTRG